VVVGYDDPDDALHCHSRVRHGDQEPRTCPAATMSMRPPNSGARCDRPGRHVALEAHAVVLDAHAHLVRVSSDIDIRVLCTRMTPHVGDALAHDLQDMVDEIG
jgi:hypothetical protein